MTLFLIRHATAGLRNRLDPSDDERPLDDHGLTQATRLAEALREYPLELILSSAALRCRQTVEPLANELGLEVTVHGDLSEGTPTVRSLGLVQSLSGRFAVLCSHGDVIPDLLRALRLHGAQIDGRSCAKGSIWALDNTSETIATGSYFPDPAELLASQ